MRIENQEIKTDMLPGGYKRVDYSPNDQINFPSGWPEVQPSTGIDKNEVSIFEKRYLHVSGLEAKK
jgi:hypothetical protein